MVESEFDFLKWQKYCRVHHPEKLSPPYDKTNTYELVPPIMAAELRWWWIDVGPECGLAYHQIIESSR